MLTEIAPCPPPNLHAARAAAGKKGATSRWGGRGSSKTVRVDEDAAAALATVPERDRRRVASDAIRAGVAEYRASYCGSHTAKTGQHLATLKKV